MPYSVSSITTAADCDLLINMTNKQKNDLAYRKLSLERQRANYAETSLELEAELQTVNAEAAALDAVIATLPDGDVKDDNVTRKKRLELKQFLLTEKKENYGGVALLDKEYDLARVNQELTETDAFIAALEARKAALLQPA
jgi:hypothetical protein